MPFGGIPSLSPADNMSARTASQQRNTAETRIKLSLDLDGDGRSDIATGIPFFDHMLTLFSRHSLIDLQLEVPYMNVDNDLLMNCVLVPRCCRASCAIDILVQIVEAAR